MDVKTCFSLYFIIQYNLNLIEKYYHLIYCFVLVQK